MSDELTASAHGASLAAEPRREEVRNEDGLTYAEAMDRICNSCYGQGQVCAVCESNVFLCDLYTHCGENPERATCEDCEGTGLKLNQPRGLNAAEDA